MEDRSALYIRQTGGQGGDLFSRFRRDRLYASEDACCAYTNKDCSKEPRRDYEVKFWVSHIKTTTNRVDPTGYEITCPAGGFIIFSGTWEDRRFQVFDADSQPVDFYLEHVYRNYAKRENVLDDHENEKNNAHHDDNDQGEPMV
ncbi:hypothetical protein BDB00DRAFT_790891 [Zychaea mexicana]|uniref:uncharacterized protein n=1 Tax=Zychaea mexicana TaxID=64656 RepID=UPI0022FF3393|nr:uncharacterized protein BDB00DRAFT_790891 [Zychaea mexicana]KAI9489687.1 hypothetical protein BDB00DRAFT_790891 [Zychaea mexicana]